MKARWRKELAAGSNSSWFVGIETERVSVLAPPGVPVYGYTEAGSSPKQPAGWRWGIWDRDDSDHWPILDDEPPRAVREVTTRDVLQLLEEELHELVWSCLWNQLQISRRIGTQREDAVPSEDLARAGALSTAWLRAELSNAFPDRRDLLELYDCNPAFEQAMGAPEDPSGLVEPPATSSVMSWLARKILARRDHSSGTEPRREWRAGDPLDGGAYCGADPGDLSAYGWGEESGSEHGIDLVTDAVPAEARFEEGFLPAGSGST